jgi:plastocyanin
MKKAFLRAGLFIFSMFTGHTTVHTVTVSNNQFSPKTLTNVVVGDIIEWTWLSGPHTTTSLALPTGAAAWDEPINASNTSFQYTVLVAGKYDYECTIHSPLMTGSFTASAVIPILLKDFRASNNGHQSTLQWITSSEQNTDHFSVRRSMDGTDFFEIGRLPAAGNSFSQRSYSFTDKAVPVTSRYVYYQIVTVDKDGQLQFSAIRMIVNSAARSRIITSITPNPISKPGHLMLQFNADKPGYLDVVLVNPEGKLMVQVTMNAAKGVNNGHIHLGDIPPGAYTLVFVLNGAKETHQVVVR